MFPIIAESIASNSIDCVQLQYATEECINKSLNVDQMNMKNCQLIRSISDQFDYRLHLLPNGVRVLLISDPSYHNLSMSNDHEKNNVNETKIDESSSLPVKKNTNINDKLSSLVVGVGVGSFSDPDMFPGLAHMLEHMIFMGSNQFPNENDIEHYLSANGGYSNATTECEYTMYELMVERRSLRGAIERFSSAFINPLLSHSSIEREIEPIDTEFVSAITDDNVRCQLLLTQIANRQHPASKFLWGNRRSLIESKSNERKQDIREQLIKFFNDHYRPNNIVVIVQSQESLENLHDWTCEMFSKIPVSRNTNIISPKLISAPAFEQEQFHRLYRMESIDNGTQLLISWLMSPIISDYQSSPINYLSTIISYGGRGGLLSILRQHNYAFKLSVDADNYTYRNNNLYLLLTIDIQLTDNGYQQIDLVIQLLMNWIDTIRSNGPLERFAYEQQTISLASFTFKSESHPVKYALELATNLLGKIGVQHTLIGNRLNHYRYNPESIMAILTLMQPKLANFIIMSNGKLDPNRPILIEPWSLTKYQIDNIPSIWIDGRSKMGDFKLPESNPYIATNFDLIDDQTNSFDHKSTHSRPIKIHECNRYIVWYKPDHKFNLPKASIQLHLCSPMIRDTLIHTVLRDILIEYLKIVLKESAFDAILANLNWSLGSTGLSGLHIGVSGFDHNLSKLIIHLLEQLKMVQFDHDKLETIKLEMGKSYHNYCLDSESFCHDLFMASIINGSTGSPQHYTSLERWSIIDSINIQSLNEYRNMLIHQMSIEMLIQGNMTHSQTINLFIRIRTFFDHQTDQSISFIREKLRIVQLPIGSKMKCRALTLSRKNRISTIMVYQQLVQFTFHDHCYLELFSDIMSQVCFDKLRTEEGLGYSVGCSAFEQHGILGFSVSVSSNSDRFDCSFVEDRIRNFIDQTAQNYIHNQLSEERFQKFVHSTIVHWAKPDLSLSEEVHRHFGEIVSLDYCFDRADKCIRQLKQAKLDDLKSWCDEHIFHTKSNDGLDKRRYMTFQIVGNGTKSIDECLTFDEKPIVESMIPDDQLNLVESKQKPSTLQLLRSRKSLNDDGGKGFISSLDEIRRLESFSVQRSFNEFKDWQDI